ncbi:unnamed protein product [Diatraea saccharalis]|uniref:FZ domain-containing protein n=1 Tax=Diatraea saccharalis TaxID=40085 RepID=A0A9N9R336_9NEOP|nr:unnamed protein product [Diatraea saccharalis]
MIKIIVIFATVNSLVYGDVNTALSCAKINVKECQGIGYNYTTLSSRRDISRQKSFSDIMTNVHPYVRSECSPQFDFLLCTAYFPMCIDGKPPIGPCRAFCQKVRDDCEVVLKLSGHKWPEDLDCSRFYGENDHMNLCIVSNKFCVV